MFLKLQNSVCICLLIFASTTFSFAAEYPIEIQIKPASETVKAFRYQTGVEPGDSWMEVDVSSPPLLLEGFDTEKDVLFIQQSENLVTWSNIYKYQYNPKAKAWEISPTTIKNASSIESVDIQLHGLYPYGTSATCYSYVLGGGLKISFALDKKEHLIGYGEVAYSCGPSETDWVDSMQAVSISVGMGYRFHLGNKLQATPELGYGAIFHILNGDFNEDSENSLEIFTDQQVRLSLNLSYALGTEYEIFLAPLGVLFFEDGDIGTLFGGQSGIRVHF